jgi:hypothetical protein
VPVEPGGKVIMSAPLGRVRGKRLKKYRRAKRGPNRLDIDETPTLLAKIMPTVLCRGHTHIVRTNHTLDRRTVQGGLERTFLGA